MSFQKNTVLIALAILAIFLLVIGIMLWRSNKNVQYPPDEAECPDYWTVIGDHKCKSGKDNNGDFGPNQVHDFSPAFLTKETKMALCHIMKNQQTSKPITWDGITNVDLC